MKECKHVWAWKEKKYQDGIPQELSVWCSKCGESHELELAFGPVESKEQREKRLERFNKELDRLMQFEIDEAERMDKLRQEQWDALTEAEKKAIRRLQDSMT